MPLHRMGLECLLGLDEIHLPVTLGAVPDLLLIRFFQTVPGERTFEDKFTGNYGSFASFPLSLPLKKFKGTTFKRPGWLV